ncbi:MAG: hypothetical protein ACI4WG_02585 [Erysipelotrichaceae bacterium]
MEKALINKTTTCLSDNKFLKMYDNNYQKENHYYFASRRDRNNLIIHKNSAELLTVNPDGVGCVVIVNREKLLLNYEYRYPIGQSTVSVVAGLVESDEDIIQSA